MATVDALLTALHDRTDEYLSQQTSTAQAAMRGWHRVALNAMRILVMTSPPADVTKVLKALLTGVDQRDAPVNAPMTAIGYTLGVLADTLNSHPDTVKAAGPASRSQLRTCVLDTLHHLAESTLTALPADPSPASRGLIRDLAGATEAAAYVPWTTVDQPLAGLSLGPIPGSLDHAVDRWARCATDILTSPSRVTSYAFQRTAATIASLCLTAATVLDEPAGERPTDHRAATLLAAAAKAWQNAADWPPEVRLGGRTTPLRQRSSELDEALASHRRSGEVFQDWQDTIRRAVLRAENVAACHQAALLQVVADRSLWVSVGALGANYLSRHPGAGRADWVPDPGTPYGRVLLAASDHAGGSLRNAAECLDRPVTPVSSADALLGPQSWETVTPSRQLRRARSTTAPARSRSLGR